MWRLKVKEEREAGQDMDKAGCGRMCEGWFEEER